MDLCTADYQQWGRLVEVVPATSGSTYLRGIRDEGGTEVFIPVEEILAVHDPCVRLSRPRSEIDAAGWDIPPAAISD